MSLKEPAAETDVLIGSVTLDVTDLRDLTRCIGASVLFQDAFLFHSTLKRPRARLSPAAPAHQRQPAASTKPEYAGTIALTRTGSPRMAARILMPTAAKGPLAPIRSAHRPRRGRDEQSGPALAMSPVPRPAHLSWRSFWTGARPKGGWLRVRRKGVHIGRSIIANISLPTPRG